MNRTEQRLVNALIDAHERAVKKLSEDLNDARAAASERSAAYTAEYAARIAAERKLTLTTAALKDELARITAVLKSEREAHQRNAKLGGSH